MHAKYGPIAAAALLVAVSGAAHAQTIKRLRNQAPEPLVYGLLLTDGTVLAQGSPGPHGGSLNHWFKLTPDSKGSYLNGTWTQAANAPYSPLYVGGAVLADGRLAIIGGEYIGNNFVFTLSNRGALYDPVANSWVKIPPPTDFHLSGNGFQNFGDSATAVLPSGVLLVGQKTTRRDVGFDPKTMSWAQYNDRGKKDFNAEEGWTLMPDGSLLTQDVFSAPNTERYIPSIRPAGWHWISDGATPADLRSPSDACCIKFDKGRKIYNPPGEIGPAMLRPDGTVFATGSLPNFGGTAGHTDVYHPGPTMTDPGVWIAGPDFQTGDNAGDNFATLEPNGDVLVEGDQFHSADRDMMPTIMAKRAAAIYATLYEFDGTHLTPLPVKLPGGSSLLPLPNGGVLAMAFNGTFIFTPSTSSATPNPAWAPTIKSVPTTLTHGQTYKITGTQFNGLSQACAYGDENTCATNYPLVRITNTGTGDVTYARTHDHSTMAVATGSKIVSTMFDVPASIETGPSSLAVVANGIASKPMRITVN